MSAEVRYTSARTSNAATVLRWTGFSGLLILALMVFASKGTVLAANTGGVSGWLADLPVVTAALALSGMGVLVAAWLLLGRLTWSDRPHSVSGSWVRRTLVLWGVPLVFVPPLFSGDVHSYLAQGAIAARGLDPYELGPATALGHDSELTRHVSTYWVDTPSPYGPVFTVVERFVAQVTSENVFAGIVLHRALAVAGLVAIVWVLPRLARRAGVPVAPALWLGVLNPLVLWHLLAGVHNDSLMLALMLVGLEFALSALNRGRVAWLSFTAGVVLIALAANVKIVAVVALAVVGTALARRWGSHVKSLLPAGLGMTAALAVVSAVVAVGTGLGFGWLGTFASSSQVNSWLAPTNWPGYLVGAVASWFGADITQSVIDVGRLLGGALAVAAVLVLILRQLRGRIEPVRALALLMSVVVVLGPVVQPWYVLWASLPFAACLGRERARVGVAVVTAALALALPATGTAGGVGDLVLGYALAFVLVAAVAWVLHWRLFASAGVPAFRSGQDGDSPAGASADRTECLAGSRSSA